MTTSNMVVDKNMVTQNGTKERVNEEGRKEEEEVHTVLDDMKEEVRGEEEIGWEEEVKTG